MSVDIDRARELVRELLLVLDAEPQEAPIPSDEITLTGTIGRPEFKTVKGVPLFTAGLGLRRVDAKLEWVSIEAWREAAVSLSAYSKGQTVTVTGKWKTNQWVDQDGVIRSRDVFVIEAVKESV